MISTYGDLNSTELEAIGCEEPERSCRILQEMAGHDVPDSLFNAVLNVVIPIIGSCADPDRAVSNLGRWADKVGNRASAYHLLAQSPAAATIFITVLAASQYFADLLISHPELLEVLTNPRIRDRSRDRDAILADIKRRVNLAKTPGGRKDALRREKPAEILRIGARDILGFADFETTVREISDFADAMVISALSICAEEMGLNSLSGTQAQPAGFAVIAMGKLGGRELNYSSDIDLIFVHGDGDLEFDPNKLGESLRSALATVTDTGFIFRVDLRLRPEGRFGPLSRSLAGCRSYYESWAESWERQALLKARFVAGDEEIGRAFGKMAEEFVFPSRVPAHFVDEIRRNKQRMEHKIAQAGESSSNVKEGYGGIRDIEFAVQLLQLTAGGANPSLRTANTLEALDRLRESGLITDEERALLRESYLFLRVVEHRLQILDERPVRNLPAGAVELRKLARRLGYIDAESFIEDYRRHTARTHRIFEELFYGSSSEAPTQGAADITIGELLSDPDSPEAKQRLMALIESRGFKDAGAAFELLRKDVVGSQYGGISPEAREAFADVSEALVNAAAATNDPDQALRGMDALAVAVPSRAALYRSLTDTPTFLNRLCWAAAEGPALWQMLLEHLEYLDLIANPEEESPAVAHTPSTPEALARLVMRNRIWTGFRDLWGLIDVETVMREITASADFVFDSALSIAIRELEFSGRFAVVGMGKLGGAELGYASDLDVLYISDGEHVAEAARVADRVQKLMRGEMAKFGISFDVDARLRPDGKKGVLALDIESYANYYQRSAATWEKQALIKARSVAGDKELRSSFISMAQQIVYGAPVSPDTEARIRAMKTRIEKERVKSANDLKLGPGGLADIEWTAQLLQLRHGHKRKKLRVSGTLPALRVLRDDAYITQKDWSILSETYREITQLRNHLYLSHGVGINGPAVLPTNIKGKMAAVRSIVKRLFFED